MPELNGRYEVSLDPWDVDDCVRVTELRTRPHLSTAPAQL